MLWSLLFISLIGSAHLDDCTAFRNTQKVTLNGTTSQSSNYADGNVPHSSGRAIDGDTTQCAHTLELQNSWWRIDLLGVYKISCICIYNKDQEDAHKKDGQSNTDITDAQVHIGNSREKNGTANSICKSITEFELNAWNHLECETDVSGRYITVFLPKQQHPLILCEVEIYGTIKESPFVLIRENKTWEDALYYCRDKHTDLASILDEETQAWAELEARRAETAFVWLGLHYTCTLEFWFWVEDHRLDFNRWAPSSKTEECDMSVAMDTKEDHLWFSKSDYKKFNFICAK